MLPKKFAMIINLDNQDRGGTHWTCAYDSGNGQTYYYDSFGAPPSDEIIKKLKVYAYSDAQHQHVLSQSCGIFCVKVLTEAMNNNQDFETIINKTLNTQVLNNEKKISAI